MVAFSIATLKVGGIPDDDKRARIFEYLRSLKYDFYLLEETQVQTEDIEAWPTEWGTPVGALPYKPIRDVPFFLVSFLA